MKRPVASAKPNSSVVMVVDTKTGRTKYFVSNRSIVIREDRETGETETRIVDRLTKSDRDFNVWDMVKRRYRGAVRLFRETIDDLLRRVNPNIPEYRDCDVSEIIATIKAQENVNMDDVALVIYNLIEGKKDGNSKSKDEAGI